MIFKRNKNKKKQPKSLSSKILIGLVSGIFIGLFFGEYVSSLSILGGAFIGLLQMTVLPYIMLSLMVNIGRLSIDKGMKMIMAYIFKRIFPQSNVVKQDSVYNFFNGKYPDLDAMLTTAEAEASWTLLFPEYQVVNPFPEVTPLPLVYTIGVPIRNLKLLLTIG